MNHIHRITTTLALAAGLLAPQLPADASSHGAANAGITIDSVLQELPPVLFLEGSFEQTVEIFGGTATLSYDLTHYARGRLRGSGTLDFISAEQSFSAPLRVHGRIGRVGWTTRVRLQTRSRGQIDRDGVQVPFGFRSVHVMEFDPAESVLFGRTRAEARAPNEREVTDDLADAIQLPEGMDGSWNLHISEANQRGLSTAEMTLSDGTQLSFLVRANNREDGLVYRLQGRGLSRGSVLNVLVDAEGNVPALRGNVLNQPLVKQ